MRSLNLFFLLLTRPSAVIVCYWTIGTTYGSKLTIYFNACVLYWHWKALSSKIGDRMCWYVVNSREDLMSSDAWLVASALWNRINITVECYSEMAHLEKNYLHINLWHSILKKRRKDKKILELSFVFSRTPSHCLSLTSMIKVKVSFKRLGILQREVIPCQSEIQERIVIFHCLFFLKQCLCLCVVYVTSTAIHSVLLVVFYRIRLVQQPICIEYRRVSLMFCHPLRSGVRLELHG